VFTSATGRRLDVSHLQERAWKGARGWRSSRATACVTWAVTPFATSLSPAGCELASVVDRGALGWLERRCQMLLWYESRLRGDDELVAGRLAEANSARVVR